MLTTILDTNNSSISRQARRILIIYDEEKIFIGDTYRLINQLSACRSWFIRAAIDINCRNRKHTALCRALLANNPDLGDFSIVGWEELDFQAYDLIFSIIQDEEELLRSLQNYYENVMDRRPWTTAVYSLSSQLLNTRLNPPVSSVFPPFTEMLEASPESLPAVRSELYISHQEINWANEWLRSHGIKDHEHLYIILDSTSERYKLITMDTYQAVLMHLLNEESARILLFDESNLGKEAFYAEWLGPDKMPAFIVAKGLGLREALCLLASDYTRLIFGPCTGMMHCASGIYNHFLRIGRPVACLPKIVTYTGRYSDGYTAEFWWSDAPLVTCLVLRKTTGDSKEAAVLSQLPEAERKDPSPLLYCADYTPAMVIKHLPAHNSTMVI
jgi:hypothetical protein